MAISGWLMKDFSRVLCFLFLVRPWREGSLRAWTSWSGVLSGILPAVISLCSGPGEGVVTPHPPPHRPPLPPVLGAIALFFSPGEKKKSGAGSTTQVCVFLPFFLGECRLARPSQQVICWRGWQGFFGVSVPFPPRPDLQGPGAGGTFCISSFASARPGREDSRSPKICLPWLVHLNFSS